MPKARPRSAYFEKCATANLGKTPAPPRPFPHRISIPTTSARFAGREKRKIADDVKIIAINGTEPLIPNLSNMKPHRASNTRKLSPYAAYTNPISIADRLFERKYNGKRGSVIPLANWYRNKNESSGTNIRKPEIFPIKVSYTVCYLLKCFRIRGNNKL